MILVMLPLFAALFVAGYDDVPDYSDLAWCWSGYRCPEIVLHENAKPGDCWHGAKACAQWDGERGHIWCVGGSCSRAVLEHEELHILDAANATEENAHRYGAERAWVQAISLED